MDKRHFIGIGLVAALLIYIVATKSDTDFHPLTKANDGYDPQSVSNEASSHEEHLITIAESYMKKHLRDPDSYEGIEWYKSKSVNGNDFDLPNAVTGMMHKYRAKNGFGGYNIEKCIFFFDRSDNVLEMRSDLTK